MPTVAGAVPKFSLSRFTNQEAVASFSIDSSDGSRGDLAKVGNPAVRLLPLPTSPFTDASQRRDTAPETIGGFIVFGLLATDGGIALVGIAIER